MTAHLNRILLLRLALAVTLTGIICRPGHCDTAATAEPGLHLQLDLGREEAYQGEAVSVAVTLTARDVTIRNIGYPSLETHPLEFTPRGRKEAAGDAAVTSYGFTGNLLVEGDGTVRVGPARLECQTMEPASGGAAFFGSLEPRATIVESLPARLRVLPLPEGRPDSFSGAVGDFSVTFETKPRSVAIDEPLTLRTTILGRGNLAAAACPTLSGPGLRAYPVTVSRRAGLLVCEQVAVPTAAVSLPPVEWSWFDPAKRRYRTERMVLPRPEQPMAVQSPQVRGGEGPQPKSSRSFTAGIWVSLALSGLLLVGFFAWRWRLLRKNGDMDEDVAGPFDVGQKFLARLEPSLLQGDVEKFYTIMFGILQEVIGGASGQPASSVASVPAYLNGATTRNYSELVDMFEACLRVRYGLEVPPREKMDGEYERIRRFMRANQTEMAGKSLHLFPG